MNRMFNSSTLYSYSFNCRDCGHEELANILLIKAASKGNVLARQYLSKNKISARKLTDKEQALVSSLNDDLIAYENSDFPQHFVPTVSSQAIKQCWNVDHPDKHTYDDRDICLECGDSKSTIEKNEITCSDAMKDERFSFNCIERLVRNAPENIHKKLLFTVSEYNDENHEAYFTVESTKQINNKYYTSRSIENFERLCQRGRLNTDSTYWVANRSGIYEFGRLSDILPNGNHIEKQLTRKKKKPKNNLNHIIMLDHKIGAKGVCVVCGCSKAAIKANAWKCNKASSSTHAEKSEQGESSQILLDFLGHVFSIPGLVAGIFILFWLGSIIDTGDDYNPSPDTSYTNAPDSTPAATKGDYTSRYEEKTPINARTREAMFTSSSNGYDWNAASSSYKRQFTDMIASKLQSHSPGITGQVLYDSLNEFYRTSDANLLRENIHNIIGLTTSVHQGGGF